MTILKEKNMTKRIYSPITTSISELKKNPSKMTHYDIICVLNRCEPAFYCVDPVRMAQLIEAEEKLKELQS
jgi:hypothetical protein